METISAARVLSQYRLVGMTALLLGIFWISACEKQAAVQIEKSGQAAVASAASDTRSGEFSATKDTVQAEIDVFSAQTRAAFDAERFDELEKSAAEIRAAKPIFRDGSWKIVRFYRALRCGEEELDSVWQTHERRHRDWISAMPESMTARVALVDFLIGDGWRARGSGFSHSVTPEGRRIFRERLASARIILQEARALREKDPFWWSVALNVALGEGWSKPAFEALIAEAHAFEPRFWGYDVARATSLLPRWYGEPGESEAYAEDSSARADGPGLEIYARIVSEIAGYHSNIFRETNASWPKTKEGLRLMRERYPDSLEIVAATASLAVRAADSVFAKEMLDRVGDTFIPSVWSSPEAFRRDRAWSDKCATNRAIRQHAK